jgi:hypothetical protein
MNNLLRYLLVAVVIGLILKYTPDVGMTDNQVLTAVLVALIVIVLADLLFGVREGMKAVGGHDGSFMFEDPEPITSFYEDEMESHPQFDFDISEPAMIQYGEFTEDLRGRRHHRREIMNDQLPSKICKSKVKSFIRQNNFMRPLQNPIDNNSRVHWSAF